MTVERGSLRILAAAILWGSIGVAGRLAFRAGVAPLEAAFYRAAISFIVLLVFIAGTNRGALRIRSVDLPLFAGFGLVSIAAFFFVYLTAIERTSVATAAILLYTAPAFVVVLSSILFGELLTRTKIGTVLLAFTGCVLVVRGYDPGSLRLNLPGVLAGLGSGFTYALYSIFGKTALWRYSPMTTLAYALGFGTVFLGAAAAATGALAASHPPQGWLWILYLALITTLLAQWLYLVGLRQIEAGRASLVATIEPVVAAVLGFGILGERMEPLQILGGVLILTAVVSVRREPARAAAA